MFNTQEIARFKETPTPFYYYNLDLLEHTLIRVKEASAPYNYNVHYAFKANTNNQILELIHQHGLGADCVSGNEVKKAIECGYSSDEIVFAGVGKTDKEINIALDHDIFCFNCESLPELEVINELAAAKGKTAQIALRINPNVAANTHAYITTGLEENK
ncbi:MAG: diaminopimelate decarboxylase, partial [Vicingaceae bacterium]